MPLHKFELLSLVGRKKREETPPPPSSSHSSIRPPYTSGFNRSTATLPPPPPPPAPTVPSRDGFYSSVQYERLTPSVNGRPPVLGSSSVGSARSSSFHSAHMPPVQYERLGSSSAGSVSAPSGFGSSVRLPSPQYERITPTVSPAGGATLLSHRSPVPSYRQSSPLQYDGPSAPSPSVVIPPLGSRSASFPSPTTHSLPSPPVLHSPVDVPPLRSDSLRRERRPPLASVAENGSPDVAMAGDASSDQSTPFSTVMGEWMSQLRTPTPDVMLLPSPYDFNKDTPTPVERMEDIKHINEALLPTPPPAAPQGNDVTQGTKSSDFVLSSANANNRRPLVEDIASLCRDLITQEVSEQLAKRLMKMGAFASAPSASAAVKRAVNSLASSGFRGSSRNDDDDDDDDQYDDTNSMNGSAAGGKGKRRKMCTNEGCQNLSRSRGLCKAHGGGRRCSVEGCSRASQSGSLCITHGGGKRCTVDGCEKAAQSRGMCKAHGGGVRCRVEGCTKSSQGDGYCRTHGGGRRCGHESGCQKWAQRNGMCMAHSEGRYGNSYRGRVARRQDDTTIDEAAEVLVKASSAPVS